MPQEDCHTHYSYYFFPQRKMNSDICEGIGDYSNGSVLLVGKGKFKLKSYNKENHLGHIYQYITLLLGMKPEIMNIKLWVCPICLKL